MPARNPTQDDKHWAGEWPVTLRRVRHFISQWKGEDSQSVPFSLHAIKLLLAIVDGEIDPPGEPIDAPWMTAEDPKSYTEWMAGYRAKHKKMPPIVAYTEADKVLHNAIEETGPPPPKPEPEPVDDGLDGFF